MMSKFFNFYYNKYVVIVGLITYFCGKFFLKNNIFEYYELELLKVSQLKDLVII